MNYAQRDAERREKQTSSEAVSNLTKMVEIVRNMGEMVEIAETAQNMGGMTSKLRKIWEKWLKLPAIRRKNIRASD